MEPSQILKLAKNFQKKANELASKYIAIVLTDESKKLLLEYVPPKFKKVFAHHVTLEFKPSEDLLESFGEGERVPIEVLGECFDEKAQAVIVSLPNFFDEFIREQDRLPHVTISTNKVPPVYSNELIKNGTNFNRVNLTLQGHVTFVRKG